MWLRVPSQTHPSAFTVLADVMSSGDVEKTSFNKAWASFVDISTGLDAIGADYVIMADKDCSYHANERVQKWLRSRKLNEQSFDACGVKFPLDLALLLRTLEVRLLVCNVVIGTTTRSVEAPTVPIICRSVRRSLKVTKSIARGVKCKLPIQLLW